MGEHTMGVKSPFPSHYCSLFPEIEKDRQRAAVIADGLLRYFNAPRQPWEMPTLPFTPEDLERQTVLLAGLDCLPGQENLFPTDGDNP
jgi:hypothetical protein